MTDMAQELCLKIRPPCFQWVSTVKTQTFTNSSHSCQDKLHKRVTGYKNTCTTRNDFN